MRHLLLILGLLPWLDGSAQITATQAKAMDSYINYANQSAEEVEAVVRAIQNYYPATMEERSWQPARFTCPVQPDEYYYKTAAASASSFGVQSSLHRAFLALKTSADAIDQKCKALDTYHKLEDHKKDKYTSGRQMAEELAALVDKYSESQRALFREAQTTFRKLNSTHSYTKIADAMLKELSREQTFLDLWKYNLRAEFPSSWIESQLKQSILETDAAVKLLSQNKPTLSYPASSMWPSFIEALSDILKLKRDALDEYNFEARKTSKHQNDVYLSLINYYNGALLSSYNTFLQFAANDKFYGLKAIKYVPRYHVNQPEDQPVVSVTPFEDIPYQELPITPSASPISKPVFTALSNYVDFINETYRQISHHRDVIRNLNSSASYQASLRDFTGKGPLYFKHDDFKMPHSHFQKTINESKNVPPAMAKQLNNQSQVLMNILKEIDDIGAALESEVTSRQYQKDGLKKLYDLMTRTITLFETWDDKKETLFLDVLRIFDSYKPADATSSWYRSGKALRNLTALDREALFQAKAFYKGSGSSSIATDRIDATLREVIANEYENMKGIQKYGRNHGLCPYTPYEDLPKNSRSFSELLQKVAPAKDNSDPYRHPYHSIAYMYNVIVDDYNKFCELSPVPHLQYINQPELFTLIPPKPVLAASNVVATNERTTATNPDTPVTQRNPAIEKSTIARKEVMGEVKLIRDTVYIERRDTIYLHDPADNVRSMEGYAVNNMVLLLDVSGSMNAPEKLPLLKKSVLNMLSMMRKEDEISIIVFSGKPKTILEGVSFKDEDKIRKAINSLKPSGKTDGNAGLKLGYKVADANYIRGGNNRIVLATDGEFPLSEEIETLVTRFSTQDIFLTVFNFGNRNASSKNLERITTLGRGNYEFVSKENVELKLIREAKSKRAK